jgi:hypothetical protein
MSYNTRHTIRTKLTYPHGLYMGNQIGRIPNEQVAMEPRKNGAKLNRWTSQLSSFCELKLPYEEAISISRLQLYTVDLL